MARSARASAIPRGGRAGSASDRDWTMREARCVQEMTVP